MAEKKKKKRRAYLDAFQKDEKGKYEYRGDFYIWQNEGTELRQELLRLWAACAVMMASLIAAGCVNAPGAVNCAYVLIPYTISFLVGISVCWGMHRLTAGGHPLRAYVYQASIRQIPGRAVCTATGAGAAIAGELVYVLRNGMEEKTAGFICFILLEGTALAAALSIRRRVCKMKWEKQEKSAKEESTN